MMSAGTGLINMLPPSIAKAMAINPAAGSSYMDAEHVVLLMQENRSFDHAYGTLQGVRGYNDPRAIVLPNGNPVWLQPDKENNSYAPFRLDIRNTRATWMHSLPHSWENQVDARNQGRYDGWIESKRSGTKEYRHMPLTMGHYTREDIPFYYAFADAFTICDHHFCSSLTGTTPNRLYFWTGTVREEQKPELRANVWNSDADEKTHVSWKTFPERLEENGISWKIYQNEISDGAPFAGEEDAWLGNFGDNPIEYFKQFNRQLSKKYIDNVKDEQAKQGLREKASKMTDAEKSIHNKAFTTNDGDPDFHRLSTISYDDDGTQREMQIPAGDVLHQFRQDVQQGRLPAVSWLVAPENYSDHPSAAWFGAWYISEVLDILTKNPEVWKKTIFILTYDENDGYFDHLPPFTAPDPDHPDTGRCSSSIHTGVEYVKGKAQQSSEPEDVRDSAIGLGYRVPMIIASPWTRGGWVNSQVFDHTSSLQFLETFLSGKFNRKIEETNISAWRRTVCGDLTSVFREYHGEPISVPAPVQHNPFVEDIHRAKFKDVPNNYKRLSPAEIRSVRNSLPASGLLPHQEPGIRQSNALPYELYADGKLSTNKDSFIITLRCGREILGKSATGSPFQVYAYELNGEHPVQVRSYALTAGDELKDSWLLNDFRDGRYHLRVYGPNGFYREFSGAASEPHASVSCRYDKRTGNPMLLVEGVLEAVDIIDNAYHTPVKPLKTAGTNTVPIDVSKSYGWYDFSVKPKTRNWEKRFAGRVETGKHSMTDPFMGRV